MVRYISRGGMGAIYEVADRATDRRRALKVMHTESFNLDQQKRYQLEATITGKIESDNVINIFDAGMDPETGVAFLVMELLKGEELSKLLKREGRLTLVSALSFIRQIGSAIDRAHEVGVVHRDLKPDNIFIVEHDDGASKVKVLDFGIAKVMRLSADAPTTQQLGTPLYMSPEQIRGVGDIDGRSDLYALAHVAYAMLVGRPYWKDEIDKGGGLHEFFTCVVEGPKELPSIRASRSGVVLSKGFDAWFAKATAVERSTRFSTAGALVQGLTNAVVEAESSSLDTLQEAPDDSATTRTSWATRSGNRAITVAKAAVVGSLARAMERVFRLRAQTKIAVALVVAVFAAAILNSPRGLETATPEVAPPPGASMVHVASPRNEKSAAPSSGPSTVASAVGLASAPPEVTPQATVTTAPPAARGVTRPSGAIRPSRPKPATRKKPQSSDLLDQVL